MITQIQFVKIPVSDALTVYTEKKLEKLMDRFEMIKTIDVYFRIENDPTGNGKICEIECGIAGGKIFAKASKKYHEHALKVAMLEIDKQLEKKKAMLVV